MHGEEEIPVRKSSFSSVNFNAAKQHQVTMATRFRGLEMLRSLPDVTEKIKNHCIHHDTPANQQLFAQHHETRKFFSLHAQFRFSGVVSRFSWNHG